VGVDFVAHAPAFPIGLIEHGRELARAVVVV
jgi:hypothetical protein